MQTLQNNYENEGFDSESIGRNSNGAGDAERRHQLKLAVDFLTVKDLNQSASISVQYSLRLTNQTMHNFKSSPPTPVNQNGAEVKVSNAFASYDFQASKSELFGIFSDNQLHARILHMPSGQEIGTATVELREIMSAPMKRTPQASVRVCDQYLPIRDSQGSPRGLIRCIIYLQDMGEVAPTKTMGVTRQQSMGQQENRNPNEGSAEYQAVWQLEMWKRAEEAKFKAWLKQREMERIEEITLTWKTKETDRERQFVDAMNRAGQLEVKVRNKALDLQRREERIVQLEEELKQKITEVSRQLTLKEEEIVNVKKRFKEERTTLEMDKKRLQGQTDELKSRTEAAEARLLNLKREIEESPISVLRSELASKNVELIESDTRSKQAVEERDEARRKFELLKKDMVTLKRQIDREQKDTLQRQAEELDKLKNDIRNKQVQEDERREINALKTQLATISNKLSSTNNQPAAATTVQGKAAPETLNDRSYNPFQSHFTQGAASGNIFLDNYAKQQASPQKPQQANGTTTEIERLHREREDLLRSGCYTQDDPLIMELDRQIRANQLRVV